MIFELTPYKRLGPLEFFMTREQVRENLQLSYRETSSRAVSKNNLTDCFDTKLFVSYDQDDRCIAFEFGLDPDTGVEPMEILWNGVNLSRMNYHDLLEYSQSMDDSIVVDEEGFDSLKYGYGAWCPDYAYDKSSMPQSLLFFVRGYRDE